MNRKIIAIIAGIVLILAIAVYSSWASYQASLESFRCDRMTKEALATDKYCDSYSTYLVDYFTFRIVD